MPTEITPRGGAALLERPRALTPLGLFEDLRAEMETFFDRFWTPRRYARTASPWLPTMDVYQKDDFLCIDLDLPGLNRKNVQIRFENGDLILRGERKDFRKIEEEDFHRTECTFGTFYRRIPLPQEVKAEKIEAKFTDGVLQIKVPLPKGTPFAGREIPIA